jgi:hypothetical protein
MHDRATKQSGDSKIDRRGTVLLVGSLVALAFLATKTASHCARRASHEAAVLVGTASDNGPLGPSLPQQRRMVRQAPKRFPVPRRDGQMAVTQPASSAVPSPALGWEETIERWKNEPADVDWTENVTSYLTSVVFLADAGSAFLRNVDCRQTICEIATGMEHFAQLRRAQEMLEGDGVPFRYRLGNDGDGKPRITVLIERPTSASNDRR